MLNSPPLPKDTVLGEGIGCVEIESFEDTGGGLGP